MRNIFLTGIPGVGKTTILERFLTEYEPPNVGGYYTRREITDNSRTFWLVDRTTGSECLMARMSFADGTVKPEVNLAAFEPFAVETIRRPCGLLVLDELGRFEEPCETFKNAVHDALDESVPVLGILKVSDTPFVNSIAARGDVLVLTVTEENRNSVYAEFSGAAAKLLAE